MTSKHTLEGRLEDITSRWENERAVEKKESKKIHDPIHGTIVLDDYLVSIIDLPLVQRLREIKQLGPAERLYPGANHTRFEHTLGVYATASKIIDKFIEENDVEITPTQRKEVKVAALLHDVGHLPFSHMSEQFLSEFSNIQEAQDGPTSDVHELIGYKFLETSYFGNRIDDINDAYGIGLQSDRIRNMIVGQTESREYAFLTNIIHGPLDADRIDYLLRDSYKVGLPTVVDADRLLETLIPVKDHESPEGHRRLGIQEKGTEAAESLFIARDRLKPTIHNHHVTLIAENMILREIVNVYEDDPLKLVGQTDYDLFRTLIDEGDDWFKRYRNRTLPKRHQYFTIASTDDKGNKRAKQRITEIDLETLLQLEAELDRIFDSPLVIVNKPERNPAIGDTVVDRGDDVDPEELVIELNRHFKSKSVPSFNPEIQVHTSWKDLESKPENIEEIKEMIADSFSINESAIQSKDDFRPKTYSRL